jgi:hypothetical protein
VALLGRGPSCSHLPQPWIQAFVETDHGLTCDTVQTHQSNYQRIESLRTNTAMLDSQIKDTVIILANTRKELVATPATVFPKHILHDVKYDELLNYARMISKTTIPPTGALNSLPLNDSRVALESQIPETAATTPAASAATPNGAQSTPNQSFEGPSQLTSTTAGANLPEHMNSHMNPHSHIEFIPFPHEGNVRGGSMASMGYLAEKGVDPEGFDPEEAKARKERDEEERRQQEERERAEREERERRMREDHARMRAEREQNRQNEAVARAAAGGVPPSASPVGEKKQFHFMDDDDDDSDN